MRFDRSGDSQYAIVDADQDRALERQLRAAQVEPLAAQGADKLQFEQGGRNHLFALRMHRIEPVECAGLGGGQKCAQGKRGIQVTAHQRSSRMYSSRASTSALAEKRREGKEC